MTRYQFVLQVQGAPCLLAVITLLAGCANTIRPPETETPAEMRTVYLIDFGRHTRLAFELPDGGLVEYAYGEWRWYAKMEDKWWRAPAVMLWPTQGTLGRWRWLEPDAKARLLDQYDKLIVLELPSEADRVDALVTRLDRDFNRRSGELLRNTAYRLDFVPYDRRYWLFNNSNHAVKEWLQELGYEVRGSGIFAEWKLGSDEKRCAGWGGRTRSQRASAREIRRAVDSHLVPTSLRDSSNSA